MYTYTISKLVQEFGQNKQGMFSQCAITYRKHLYNKRRWLEAIKITFQKY